MAAQYPTAAGTDANLYLAANNISTTLNGAINSAVTTITVVSTVGFPTAGFVTIDAEAISYTGTSGTTFTGCTRGADGTTAASHTDTTQVFHDVVAAHHNVLKDEIKAIEGDLVGVMAAITPVTATSTSSSVLNRAAMFCKRFFELNTASGNWYDAFAWLSGLDQTASVTGTSATSLKNLFDQVAAQLKKITGETNWYTAPTRAMTSYMPLAGGTFTGAIAFNPTTTGITGTATNDSAAAGKVGEYFSSSLLRASAITNTTTNTWYTVTSVSLTAGDWDVSAIGGTFGSTGFTDLQVYVGTSSSSGDGAYGVNLSETTAAPNGNGDSAVSVPCIRLSLSGTTTVYLNSVTQFTGGTSKTYGTIHARRVR